MNDRGRGDQAVDVAARPERCDATPFHGDPVGDRYNPIRMVMAQLLQPLGKPGGSLRIGFLSERDAAHDLAQSERAEIDRLRTDRSQPARGLPAAAAGLGDDIRVDEIQLEGSVAARRLVAVIDGGGDRVVPVRT